MSKVIIYKKDGAEDISILYPLGSVEDSIKDVPVDTLGNTIPYKIVNKTNIPTDREFRDAWRLKSTKIDIDIEKAKEIKKEKLRAERAPMLAALDVEFQRALEEGRGTAVIVAEKNRLRDITKEVDKVNTIEALKAVKVE